jgi:hypothetical protein
MTNMGLLVEVSFHGFFWGRQGRGTHASKQELFRRSWFWKEASCAGSWRCWLKKDSGAVGDT